jgi:uncharacterized protein (DUF2141 family)
MKTLSVLIASLATNFIFAQESITVTMTGMPNDKGVVLVGLYSEGTFMKAAPEHSASSKIEDGTAKVVFEDIPAGEYAIAVIQDENENKQMDFETNGMPKEAYGSSNNIPNPFGPPLWENSKFKLGDQPVDLEIKMMSM